MLSSIRLKNWRSHFDSALSFSGGTNVLLGRMGAGKSSVVNACCFALFGTFPALMRKEVSTNDLIMRTPQQADGAELSLEFSYGGKVYLVERKLFRGKKTNQAVLYRDGKLIAGPQVSQVNARVEEILQTHYDLFARAVYAEQNQMDQFLAMTPRQRREGFDELLDLERYTRVRRHGVTVKNTVGRLARTARREAQQLKDSFDPREQKVLGEEIEELEKKRGQHEKGVAGLQKEIKKAQSIDTAWRQKEERFEELRRQLDQMRGALQAMQRDMAALEKRVGSAQELEKAMKALEEEEKKLAKEISQAEAKRETVSKEVEKTLQQAAAAKARNEELASLLVHLESGHAKCPVCEQELGSGTRKAVQKKRQNERAALEKEAAGLAKRVEEARRQASETATEEKQARAALEKVGEKRRALEEAQALEEKRKEKEARQKELEGIEKQIKTLGFEPEKARKAREALRDMQEAQRAEERAQQNVAALLEEKEKRRQVLGEQRKSIEKLEQHALHYSGMEEKMAVFVNALEATQGELREGLVENINTAMAAVWQDLYPYADYSNAHIRVENGEYELVVEDAGGQHVRIEGNLSGGERSAAAIAVRVAFSLVLAGHLSLLVLDEPTHNLDEESVSKLGAMLSSRLPKLIGQVFLITHDQSLAEATQGKTFQLERDREEMGFTQTQLLEK